MADPSTLAVFFVATLALLVVPGPAVLYIVARGIDQGRAAGLASVLGISVGSLVHVAAAAFGLSAILLSSATAFAAVKYLGAAYLVFLGIRTLLSRDAGLVVAERPPRSLGRIFAQGVAVQVLNPKMALFIFAFLPQFVDPARGSVALQTLFFGGILVAMGACTDSTYALLAGSAGSWLKRHAGFVRSQRYVAGTVYLGLGVTTALVGVERT
jgi:threonine/homoserine/homoserine lactone efflux protein